MTMTMIKQCKYDPDPYPPGPIEPGPVPPPDDLDPRVVASMASKVVKATGCTTVQAHTAIDDMLAWLHNPTSSGPPSEIIDEAWHAFILHTRDYITYCFAHFGHLIHHVPNLDLCDGECGDEVKARRKCDAGCTSTFRGCDPRPCGEQACNPNVAWGLL